MWLRWWEAYRMVTGDWPGEKCRRAGRAFRGAVDGGGGKGRARVERKDGRTEGLVGFCWIELKCDLTEGRYADATQVSQTCG